MKTYRLLALAPALLLCTGCIAVSVDRHYDGASRDHFACDAGELTIVHSKVPDGPQRVQDLSGSFQLSEADRAEASAFFQRFKTVRLSFDGCSEGRMQLAASGTASGGGPLAGRITVDERGLQTSLE